MTPADSPLSQAWRALERAPLDRRDDPSNIPAAIEVVIAADLGRPVPNNLPAALDARMIAEAIDNIVRLRVVVLSTTWPWRPEEKARLAGRLAREADLFAFTLPVLGRSLGQLLSQELAAAGKSEAAATVASRDDRLGLRRLLGQSNSAAQALGCNHTIAHQPRLARPTPVR